MKTEVYVKGYEQEGLSRNSNTVEYSIRLNLQRDGAPRGSGTSRDLGIFKVEEAIGRPKIYPILNKSGRAVDYQTTYRRANQRAHDLAWKLALESTSPGDKLWDGYDTTSTIMHGGPSGWYERDRDEVIKSLRKRGIRVKCS